MTQKRKHVQVVLAGDIGVGKGTMIHTKFYTGSRGEYIPNVMGNFTLTYDVNGETVYFSVEKTATRDYNQLMREILYPGTDCFIFCYSVADRRTLESLINFWIPEVKRARNDEAFEFILCGTKNDLKRNVFIEEHVTIEMVRAMFDEPVEVFEVSSLDESVGSTRNGGGLDAVFNRSVYRGYCSLLIEIVCSSFGRAIVLCVGRLISKQRDIERGMLKILFVGNNGVGKTSIALSYLGLQVTATYRPTITERLLQYRYINGEKLLLEFFETGHEEFYSQDLPYTEADCIIFCYSIVDKHSAKSLLEKWIPEVQDSFQGKGFPFLICGTKSDLRETVQSSQRVAIHDISSSIAMKSETVEVCSYEQQFKTGESEGGVSYLIELAIKKAYLNTQSSHNGKTCILI